MGVFDLLFVLFFFGVVGMVLRAAFLNVQGHRVRALTILRRLGMFIAAYVGVIIILSMVLPRRMLTVGDPICFDDWCVAVNKVSKKEIGQSAWYRVDFKMSSRAKRTPQRETDLTIYMTGDRGERFEPRPSGSITPFDVTLAPGESVVATRVFIVPAKVNNPGIVVTHEGGFPIGWFIIGYESWFRKPTIVLI